MRIRRSALSMVGGAAVILAGHGLSVGQSSPPATRPAVTRPAEYDEIVAKLLHGDSATRSAAMKQMVGLSPTHYRGIDPSFLPAVAACAHDPSAETRSQAAILIGCSWVQSLKPPPPLAVSVEEALARDADDRVRHDAVSAGLKSIENKPDDVVDALIDAGMRPVELQSSTQSQVIFGLQDVEKARLIPRLEPYWANASRDPDPAARAYALYVGATREEPPDPQRMDDVGTFLLPLRGVGGYGREEVLDELRRLVPAELSGQWYVWNARGAVVCDIVVSGAGRRRKIIAALKSSKVLTFDQDVDRWCDLTTPEEIANIRALEAAASTQPAPAGRETYVAAFQQLYDHLGRVYPNFEMKGIDWKAAGDELLPRARQARTQREFGLLVEELVARLQDSHAAVMAGAAQPPEPDLPQWDPGILCLMDDRDRPVVYFVEPGSSAETAGVKIGMTVVSVNGVPAEEAIRAWMRETSRYYGASSERVLRYDAARGFLSQRESGAAVNLVLETPDGKESALQLAAGCGPRYLARLPVPREKIDDGGNVSWTRLPNGAGYIYLHRIREDLEASLDAALRELGPVPSLVIDVRGNSGGGFDATTAFLNFDSAAPPAGPPGRPRYDGPIAILIDERCISAGEGWTSWFVAHHRAALFGATTAGASSRKEQYALSNGLYTVVVPVKAYTGFLDRPIERRGLEPDVPVRCTARDLAAGRDTVLQTALHWLADHPQK